MSQVLRQVGPDLPAAVPSVSQRTIWGDVANLNPSKQGHVSEPNLQCSTQVPALVTALGATRMISTSLHRPWSR